MTLCILHKRMVSPLCLASQHNTGQSDTNGIVTAKEMLHSISAYVFSGGA
jgi:hypothetical protein